MGAIYMNGICFGSSDVDMLPIVSLTYDEYEALPEETKNNGNLYLLTDVNGTGDNFQPVIYSEEEREIGVWIDGKPLYETTIKIQSLPNNTNQTYAHSISNIDLCFVKTAFAKQISGSVSFPLSVVRPKVSGGSADIGVYADATYIYLETGQDRSGYEGYITLCYTKTTDAAGSGQWTPQGIPAVHYSSDEQVVGTWIDGSTIYEKTVHVQPTGNVSDYTTFASISNIDVVLSTQFFAKRYTNGTTYYYTGNGTSSPEAVSLTQYKLGVRVSNGNVQYYVSGYDEEITDIYATIRYTKSST